MLLFFSAAAAVTAAAATAAAAVAAAVIFTSEYFILKNGLSARRMLFHSRTTVVIFSWCIVAAASDSDCRGPRLGLAYQIIIWWATARPGPLNIQNGLVRARLSPAHHIFKLSRPGPARLINFSQNYRPGS